MIPKTIIPMQWSFIQSFKKQYTQIKSLKSLYCFTIVLLLLAKNGIAQELGNTETQTNSTGIKINPYKPFVGLANIGFEFQLNRHFSVSLFAEYVFIEKLIIGKDIEHPVFVFELSLRYYFSEKEPLSGFFAAPVTGFTLKRKT